MIYYNFDGIRLPKPVELNGYNYQLICSNKDELFFTHSLMISKAPFEVLNDKICFDSAVDYQFYTARNNSTSWSEGSLTIIENDKATTTLASVIDSSDFLWTNEDIYRYESNEIVYKKFKAEEDIVALKPEIKTNLSQDKYYYQDDENIETLEIIAESPDGGELSYQWYKNGEKIEGAIFNTYKPIITEIGKNTYYCEITNNYQGDLASINSKTIIVTVAEALVPINEEFLLGWKIGRLVAMLRGQQEPIIPDTPIVSLCLYGTPSETGNIGLRDGGSMTYYDGAVLPKPLLDVSEFPYRYIAYQKIRGEMVLAYMTFQTPAIAYTAIQDGVDGTYVGVLVKAGTIQKWQRCLLSDDNKWKPASKIETGSLDETRNKYIAVFTPIVWTNVDINIRSSIYQHASDDPIPVSGLVGCSYNGEVVTAEIPEKVMGYPYVILVRNADNWYNAYGLDTEPYTEFYDGFGSFDYDRLKLDSGNECAAEYQVDEWGYVGEEQSVTEWAQGYASWNLKNIVWANFDVYASDGSLYLAKSNAIPVYEKE